MVQVNFQVAWHPPEHTRPANEVHLRLRQLRFHRDPRQSVEYQRLHPNPHSVARIAKRNAHQLGSPKFLKPVGSCLQFCCSRLVYSVSWVCSYETSIASAHSVRFDWADESCGEPDLFVLFSKGIAVSNGSNEGKPPKTVDSIRASLKSIHQTAKVSVHSGPHRHGLAKDYPITIATFYEQAMARSLQQLLSQSGVFSKVVTVRGGVNVVVDKEDHPRATEIYNENHDDFPNRYPSKEARRFDFLIFGTAIGLTVGAIIFLGVWGKPMAVAILFTFVGIGAISGHLLDRFRMGFVRSGKLVLGVWEILVAMAIPGLIILAVRIVRAIFSDGVA